MLAKQISISKTFYINFKEHIDLLNELQICIQIYLHQLGKFLSFWLSTYVYSETMHNIWVHKCHFSKEILCSFLSGFLSWLLQSFRTTMHQEKCEVLVMHIAGQWFFIVLQKKTPTLEGQIKSFLSLFNGIWMNRVKYALCIHW